MLEILRKVASGPVMGKSDISIHDQIRELVNSIELNKSPEEISKILGKLADEVNYRNYWE